MTSENKRSLTVEELLDFHKAKYPHMYDGNDDAWCRGQQALIVSSFDHHYNPLNREAQDAKTATDKEREFRKWLYASHGCGPGYCDDGELQCGMHLPPIDFKRDSLTDIGKKIAKHVEAEYQERVKKMFIWIRDNHRAYLGWKTGGFPSLDVEGMLQALKQEEGL